MRKNSLIIISILILSLLILSAPSALAYYKIAGKVGEGWDIENAVIKLFYDKKLIQTKYLSHQNDYLFDVDQTGYYLIKTNVTYARANDTMLVRVSTNQPKPNDKISIREVNVTGKEPQKIPSPEDILPDEEMAAAQKEHDKAAGTAGLEAEETEPENQKEAVMKLKIKAMEPLKASPAAGYILALCLVLAGALISVNMLIIRRR